MLINVSLFHQHKMHDPTHLASNFYHSGFDQCLWRKAIISLTSAMLNFLFCERTKKVIIKTFGQGNDSKVQELDVVQVNMKDKFENRFTLIEALCVPAICSPLTSQHIASAKNIVEFKNLEFPDHNESLSTLPVGILVGVDFYHAFMTGRIIRSRDGPIGCGTIGWDGSLAVV